jgi:FkbM family methyltransferase
MTADICWTSLFSLVLLFNRGAATEWSAHMLYARLVRQCLSKLKAEGTPLRWRAHKEAKTGEPELALLPYLVDPTKTAIDVGAAEGTYTFPLNRLAKRCIAFEPNPLSCARLQRALPKCTIHQIAISDRCGSAEIYVPVVNGVSYSGWGTMHPQRLHGELPPHNLNPISVKTTPLDHLNILDDVGFVKIDIEGHEYQALCGMMELLTRCRPNLLIEIVGTDRRLRIHQLLSPLGYVQIALSGGTLRAPENRPLTDPWNNVIFIAPQAP